MQTDTTQRELDQLQLRIAASPEAARADLQAQFDALKQALDLQPTQREIDRDAEVEALFDNMPV